MVAYSKKSDAGATLGDLLTEEQITTCKEFMKHKQWLQLRAYLNTYKTELELKGVVADYLYYWMFNKYGG